MLPVIHVFMNLDLIKSLIIVCLILHKFVLRVLQRCHLPPLIKQRCCVCMCLHVTSSLPLFCSSNYSLAPESLPWPTLFCPEQRFSPQTFLLGLSALSLSHKILLSSSTVLHAFQHKGQVEFIQRAWCYESTETVCKILWDSTNVSMRNVSPVWICVTNEYFPLPLACLFLSINLAALHNK